MKPNGFALVAMLLACLATSSVGAAILYRGRLTQNVQGETRFDAGASYSMDFRLYRLPQGGEAFHTVSTNNVGVGKDGSFEVLLDDPEIDGAFKTDASSPVYVGLALDGGRELMPRRQILMLPKTVRARQAHALAANPEVATLKARGLKAETATIGQLSAKTLKANCVHGAFSMQGIKGEEANGLDLTSNKITVFGEVSKIVNAHTATQVGEVLKTAPTDGVAFIYAEPMSGLTPRCTGVICFCRKGDAIVAPNATEPLSVRFYSFATR